MNILFALIVLVLIYFGIAYSYYRAIIFLNFRNDGLVLAIITLIFLTVGYFALFIPYFLKLYQSQSAAADWAAGTVLIAIIGNIGMWYLHTKGHFRGK